MDALANQERLYSEVLSELEDSEGINVTTSGSTGTPKRIFLSKSQLVRSALRTNEFFDIQRQSVLHSAISFEYIGGKMMIVRSVVADCTLSFQSPSLYPIPPSESEVQLMSVVPPQLHHILKRKDDFTNVKNFLVGGSPIDSSLWNRIVESGLRVYESYGMTETASHIAVRKISGDSHNRPPFFPFPGIELSVDDNSCLLIKDGNISVSTNDIVKIEEDGAFYVLGRKDNMIITGGKKILPQQLESLLSEFVDFQGIRFYVDSVPHPVWTNKIVLVLEITSPEQQRKAEDIKSRIYSLKESQIPRWCLPKEIYTTSCFPLTNNGKLKRGDQEFLASLTVF